MTLSSRHESKPVYVRLRDIIGVENMLWSTDFPHPVTSWPNSQRIIEEQFAGVPADERALILAGNGSDKSLEVMDYPQATAAAITPTWTQSDSSISICQPAPR